MLRDHQTYRDGKYPANLDGGLKSKGHESFVNVKGLNVSKRAVFVIDKDGVVAYKWISEDPKKEPNYSEVEGAVAKLG